MFLHQNALPLALKHDAERKHLLTVTQSSKDVSTNQNGTMLLLNTHHHSQVKLCKKSKISVSPLMKSILIHLGRAGVTTPSCTSPGDHAR